MACVSNILAAKVAAERLFAQVDVHVLFQQTFFEETFGWLADGTLERLVLIACVNAPDVPLQLSLRNPNSTFTALYFLMNFIMDV